MPSSMVADDQTRRDHPLYYKRHREPCSTRQVAPHYHSPSLGMCLSSFATTDRWLTLSHRAPPPLSSLGFVILLIFQYLYHLDSCPMTPHLLLHQSTDPPGQLYT